MFGHLNDACPREIKMTTTPLECMGEQSATEHSAEVDAQTGKEEVIINSEVVENFEPSMLAPCQSSRPNNKQYSNGADEPVPNP